MYVFAILLPNQEATRFDAEYVQCREDETIESAVPLPAPAKGDNRGLSPFNLGQYIALPFPENH